MKVNIIGCSTCWTDRPMSAYCLDDKILIDCGEGTTKHFEEAQVDFYAINKIFITHFHSDHIFGLVQFLAQHAIYNDESKYKSLTIYGPTGLNKHLTMLKDFAFGEEDAKTIDLDKYINIVEIDDEQKIQFGDYTVKPYRLKHGNMLNLAYIFTKDNQSIGFSGDCTYTDRLEDFAKDSDVCFLECCADKTSYNHLGYDRFLELKNKYKDNRFIAVHCIDKLYYNQKNYDVEFAKSGSVEIFEKAKNNNSITF